MATETSKSSELFTACETDDATTIRAILSEKSLDMNHLYRTIEGDLVPATVVAIRSSSLMALGALLEFDQVLSELSYNKEVDECVKHGRSDMLIVLLTSSTVTETMNKRLSECSGLHVSVGNFECNAK